MMLRPCLSTAPCRNPQGAANVGLEPDFRSENGKAVFPNVRDLPVYRQADDKNSWNADLLQLHSMQHASLLKARSLRVGALNRGQAGQMATEIVSQSAPRHATAIHTSVHKYVRSNLRPLGHK